jgi:UDP-N-acetylmuramate-alanine ligase
MSERVHILGICGTFMGGVALLARELGYRVSGSDSQCLSAYELHARGRRH